MSDATVDIEGVTSRALPQAVADNVPSGPGRMGRQRELYTLGLIPTKHLLADEGSYFVATTPVPGTGIAMTISIAFSDTVAMFALKNTDDKANPAAKRIYLDYLRLILLGTAPTAVVGRHIAIKRSPLTDREPVTAANKTLMTPVNMAGAAGRASICRALSYSAAAAMTVPASVASDPVLCRASLPTGLGISGDEYVVKFGGEDMSHKVGLTAARAADPARIITHAPPIIIEPGEWIVIHEWCLTEATNGPTFEHELAWWER